MRLALCNEVLASLPFAQQCAFAGALGCQGLEIAPFTMGDDPSAFTTSDAQAWRDTAAAHGVAISSLHWLLVRPDGLSLVSPDAPRRERTIGFLKHLIDLAAACDAEVLVHGSPKQRSPEAGQSVDDALARFEESLAALAPHAAAAGVTYCIEPLSPFETPVINTVDQAARLVERIASPALKTMLDLSAASHGELDDAATLLACHVPSGLIAHVQLNDHNRRGPGQGKTPIAPALRALNDAHYTGWLAIEPFDYHPDPLGCAAFCAGYVRALLDTLPPAKKAL